jgi:hypothetical protein
MQKYCNVYVDSIVYIDCILIVQVCAVMLNVKGIILAQMPGRIFTLK